MAMLISWVALVNPSHPYLENDPAPSFDPHHLRISPWLWFRCTCRSWPPAVTADRRWAGGRSLTTQSATWGIDTSFRYLGLAKTPMASGWLPDTVFQARFGFDPV